VKLPLNVPLEIEHVCEVNRPDGVTVKVHVMPAKFEPEATTGVPTMPDAGVKMKVRGAVTVKDADFVSATSVVTFTV